MEIDDLPKTPASPLDALEKEDLDLFSREELEDRIRRLRAERTRAEKALDGKSSHQTAAEALFGSRK